jgi:transcriptional regulator with PAS, ATPase and Fis domain
VDVRVLAATNKDPGQAVSDGHLRQDLYYRLNVFHIHLPPLRDRKQDLPLLAEHILRDLNAKHGRQVRGLQPDVIELFQGYSWPGNIRELRNVLERALIVCDRDLIGRAHLPDDFGKGRAVGGSDLSSLRFPPGATVDAVERELILQTLASTSNKTRAAELLGISLKTLHNKLKEYEAAKSDGG